MSFSVCIWKMYFQLAEYFIRYILTGLDCAFIFPHCVMHRMITPRAGIYYKYLLLWIDMNQTEILRNSAGSWSLTLILNQWH